MPNYWPDRDLPTFQCANEAGCHVLLKLLLDAGRRGLVKISCHDGRNPKIARIFRAKNTREIKAVEECPTVSGVAGWDCHNPIGLGRLL